MLYKNDLISLDNLLDICYFYNYRIDEFSYLLARLLFPTCIFDLLEDITVENLNYDIDKKIYETIKQYDNQLVKLKSYYQKVISIMNIRPINWLN